MNARQYSSSLIPLMRGPRNFRFRGLRNFAGRFRKKAWSEVLNERSAWLRQGRCKSASAPSRLRQEGNPLKQCSIPTKICSLICSKAHGKTSGNLQVRECPVMSSWSTDLLEVRDDG